jgi:predicted chitinase
MVKPSKRPRGTASVPTPEQLQAIMPDMPARRKAECLPCLQAAMEEFGIQMPARAAAFLAQVAHESGQFRFMEEIWGPTAAQRRYEPPGTLAEKLGNTETGDGRRFKGRGPIQITGRANYLRFGELLGINLVANPERGAEPDLAFRIAGLFWAKKGLNELADRPGTETFREITRRINGGFNGLADRQRFFAVACRVLGVNQMPRSQKAQRRRDEDDGPAFERGAEAIRAAARRRRARNSRRPSKARGVDPRG